MPESDRAGYVVVYPNREKAAARLTKWGVAVTLLASVVLMLIITVFGWSDLQGMKPLDILWILLYLILAFYVAFKWSRGALTFSAALAICLLALAFIASYGFTGTSWFARSYPGFAPPKPLLGVKFSANALGFVEILLAPVQALLIAVALYGFSQNWNVETELPEDEAKEKGYSY